MSGLSVPRRRFLQFSAVSLAAWQTPGVFAEMLKTPFQTEGPFYPDHLPLDTDNDLLIINDQITPAVGEITHLSGRLLDTTGAPIRNAVIEIWQVNAKGSYIHSQSANRGERDPNFQGFGRFLTGSTGEYYFRTIKPVIYPGRAPHIHVKVKRKGLVDFTTQCYIKGYPQNEKDGILRSLLNNKPAYDSVVIDFAPVADSKIGELAARFDIVMGLTPEDNAEYKSLRERDRGR